MPILVPENPLAREYPGNRTFTSAKKSEHITITPIVLLNKELYSKTECF